MHTSLVAPPSVPTGKIKSFGSLGPKYQVGEPLRALPDGDWLVQILLVETGEIAEYKASSILGDPEAE